MSLSPIKLEELLKNNGFIPKNKFLVRKYCGYITAISTIGDNIIISIPSTYKIRCNRDVTSFNIKPIDIPNDDTVQSYSNIHRDEQVERTYDEVDAHVSPSSTGMDRDGNVATTLEEYYKRRISLKDLEKKEITTLSKIYRQLKRLKYCMQNIRYKIAILYMEYIFILERDGSVEGYKIKHFMDGKNENQSGEYNFFFLIDLELFFEKTQNKSLNNDLKNIRESIYTILNRTQNKHMLTIDKVVSKHGILEENIRMVNIKKNQNKDFLEKYNKLLYDIEKKIQDKEEKIMSINLSLKTARGPDETKFIMEKGECNRDIDKLRENQKEAMKKMHMLKSKNDNLFLTADNSIFDNIVLADAIFTNLSTLGNSLK